MNLRTLQLHLSGWRVLLFIRRSEANDINHVEKEVHHDRVRIFLTSNVSQIGRKIQIQKAKFDNYLRNSLIFLRERSLNEQREDHTNDAKKSGNDKGHVNPVDSSFQADRFSIQLRISHYTEQNGGSH